MTGVRGARTRAATWGRRLVAAGLFAFLAAALVDAAFGREVTLLARVHDEDERAALRRARDPRDDVAAIYGRIEPPPGVRVILIGTPVPIRPVEDPTRRLLPVDRQAGERVLLARTLWGRVGIVALVLVGLGLLLATRRSGRAGNMG